MQNVLPENDLSLSIEIFILLRQIDHQVVHNVHAATNRKLHPLESTARKGMLIQKASKVATFGS